MNDYRKQIEHYLALVLEEDLDDLLCIVKQYAHKALNEAAGKEASA